MLCGCRQNQKNHQRWRRLSASFLVMVVLSLAGCVSPAEDRWRQYNDDGVQQFAAKNYSEALDAFDLALTHRPQDPVLIFNIGQCYDRLGDVKKAEQFYTYCLQVDSKHGDARMALVSLLYRNNRVKDANQKILDWVAQDPKSAEPYVADAWRLRQEKDLPAAQGRLQQALAIDKNNRRALTEMAILYELLGLPDRSYVLYQQILAQEPNQTEIADRLELLKQKGVKPAAPN